MSKRYTPKFVCSTCKDTHRMTLGGEEKSRDVPCTRCPVPCRSCASGRGRGAYCAETPCPCDCHKPKRKSPYELTDDELAESLRANVPGAGWLCDLIHEAATRVQNLKDPQAPWQCMHCNRLFLRCPDFDAHNCPNCGEKVAPRSILLRRVVPAVEADLNALLADDLDQRGVDRLWANIRVLTSMPRSV